MTDHGDIVVRATGLGKRYRLGESVDLTSNFRETLSGLPRMFRDKVVGLGRHGALAGGSGGPEAARNELWALRDIHLEVERGEALGIIGPNGSGKSTLLKILSRITWPTIGEVELWGRVGSLLEVGTGFHLELTGRENIYLNGAILGMRKAEIDRRFDEIVDFAGVERFLDTPVKRYSSGMRVRLGFAVAAHLEPELLIVDEVLSVGDAEFQKKCLGKMSEVASGGRTVLFVSHNMQAVRTLCQRVILLDQGRMAASGGAEDVVDQYLDRIPQSPPVLDIGPELHRRYPVELEITRVELVMADGTPSATIKTDAEFAIRMYACVHDPDRAYVLDVDFRSSDGVRLGTVGHLNQGAPPIRGTQGTTYCIELQLRNVLNAGHYLFDIRVGDMARNRLDDLEGFAFSVAPVSDSRATVQAPGFVHLHADWRLGELSSS